MKWAYGIRRKISAAMLLAAIFVLLFVKNMVENNNVSRLGSSFSSVYEDRLLVESYIYRMSDHLFRKKIMIDSASTPSAILALKPAVDNYNTAILDIIDRYKQTKLTTAEQIYFEDFCRNATALIELEGAYFKAVGDVEQAESIKGRIGTQFNEASTNLDRLSGIQVSEGKLLNETSQKIVAGSSLLTQFEVGILIAIGLMIFVLVFESTAVFSRPSQKQSLN